MNRGVVYFDQQMHACPCFCMVKNNKKCSKIIYTSVKVTSYFPKKKSEIHVEPLSVFNKLEGLKQNGLLNKMKKLFYYQG